MVDPDLLEENTALTKEVIELREKVRELETALVFHAFTNIIKERAQMKDYQTASLLMSISERWLCLENIQVERLLNIIEERKKQSLAIVERFTK